MQLRTYATYGLTVIVLCYNIAGLLAAELGCEVLSKRGATIFPEENVVIADVEERMVLFDEAL